MSNLRMKTPLDIEASDDPSLIDIGWMRIPTSPYSTFFWEGCRKHELRLPKCRACGNLWFYPTPRCTRCLEPAGDWIVSSGRGTLYSYSAVHHPLHASLANLVPYIVGVVALEEGIRMMSNIVGAEEKQLRLNMPVQVVFQTLSTGAVMPHFTPADR